MGDALFPVYNNFFIGNYQVCINEAYELSHLSGSDATERDCYLYRSHIALGSCQLVIDEIQDDAATALLAVARRMNVPVVAATAGWIGTKSISTRVRAIRMTSCFVQLL